jgi:ribonuclease E
MAKRMLIDASHPEENRVVVLKGNSIEDFDYENASRKQLKGNIYLAKVTRVEPSLQAAFVDYGGNRHGFLPFSEIHPDYYRIPIADREALLAAEASEQKRVAREDEAAGDAAQGMAVKDTQPEEDLSPDEISDSDDAGEGIPVEAADEDEDTDEGSDEGEDDGEAVAISAGADPGSLEVAEPLEEGDAPENLAANEVLAAAEEVQNDPLEADADDEAASAESEAPETSEENGEFDDASIELAGENAEEIADPEDSAVEDSANSAGRSNGRRRGRNGQSRRGRRQRRPERRARTGSLASEPLDDDGNGQDPAVDTLGGDEADEVALSRAKILRGYKIQEVIKRRQVLLVQVTKEERGNKGAALTTYLSLPGRFCVLMPNTARGGGISRKISNLNDRRRLKKVINELKIPEGIAVIVRTAGSQRSKAEIRRDYDYLLRLWDEIRETTLNSTAPKLVYEEANLIKRAIRDLYDSETEDVLVEGDDGYKAAKSFMKSLMPSHARRVKQYKEQPPLYYRYKVESQIDAMHNDVVQLRSGGYVVISSTEALVAIDVNSGRATRERHIEHTAYRTNLEAAEEIARQLRLRDLAGLIVVDFIDMEESKHNREVERRLKEAMRQDRARIQIGRISPFGLLELSRQRLRPSLIESSTITCPHCSGSGVLRSEESQALHVLRQIEEEGIRRGGGELLVTLPGNVLLLLMNRMRDRLKDIEALHELKINFDSNALVTPGTLEIERQSSTLSSAERQEREREEKEETAPGRRDRRRRRRGDSDKAAAAEKSTAEETGATAADEESGEEGAELSATGRRGRRRRGKRGGRKRGQRTEASQAVEASEETGADDSGADALTTGEESAAEVTSSVAETEKDDGKTAERPKRTRGPRRRRRKSEDADLASESAESADAGVEGGSAESGDQPDGEAAAESKGRRAPVKPARRRRSTRKTKEPETADETVPLIPLSSGSANAVSSVQEQASFAQAAAEFEESATTATDSLVVSTSPDADTEPTAPEPRAYEPQVVASEPAATAKYDQPEPAMAEAADNSAAESTEVTAEADDGPPQPKRRGWWSRPE